MSVDISIRHSFGGFGLNASFAAKETGITALFGPSGSGKSTVINAVAGLLRPDRARIVVGGEVLTDTRERVFVAARNRRLGCVFQDARLFPHLSVKGNLLFGWRRRGKPASQADIDHMIALLGLGHLLKRRPMSLSGGEQQRVALGRALLTRPRLLLLDEPLAALDQKRREEILPFLERLRDEAGIPMLYVSHTVGEVARLADSVVVLDHGRMTAHGPVGEVFAKLDMVLPEEAGDTGVVIAATVERQDRDYGLTSLILTEGSLSVPMIAAAPGDTVRVRIKAADVMLALQEPGAISANNVLAATITEIRGEDGPSAEIGLMAGGQPLMARITRKSVDRLNLTPGQTVYAVIKTVQLER